MATSCLDMTLQKWAIFTRHDVAKVDDFYNGGHDVAKVGDFYNGGSMGKIFVFCRFKLKFCSWLYKKRWHTSWKFQLEIRSNKKVMAKKPLTNLYEMNSTIFPWISTESFVVTTCIRKNRLDEKIPTNGHNIWFGW